MSRFPDPIIVKKASPNRWPIRVVRFKEYPGFYLEELDPDGRWEHTEEGGGLDFATEEEAVKAFDERVKELSETPNWEAQAEYDREHGTINGYAPWQFDLEREY